MKQKTIFAIAILLIIGVVGGFSVGQVINQTQFNNQDFQSESLLDKDSVSCFKTPGYQQCDINYFTFKKERDVNMNLTGDWVLVENTKEVRYYLKPYYICRDTNTHQNCVDMLSPIARKQMKQEVLNFEQDTKDWLDQQKTNYYNDLSENDFGITSEDFE